MDLPYIDQEWLIEHREGVIVLSGGTQGDIAKKLLKENISEAESAVSFYQEFFLTIFTFRCLERIVKGIAIMNSNSNFRVPQNHQVRERQHRWLQQADKS